MGYGACYGGCGGPGSDTRDYIPGCDGRSYDLKKSNLAVYYNDKINNNQFYPIMINEEKNRISFNFPIPCSLNCKFCIQKKDKWYNTLKKNYGKNNYDKLSNDKKNSYSYDLTIYPETFKMYRLFIPDFLHNYSTHLTDLTQTLKYVIANNDNYVISLFDNSDISKIDQEKIFINNYRYLWDILEELKCRKNITNSTYFMFTVRPTVDKPPEWLKYFSKNFNTTIFISFGSLNDKYETGNFDQRITFLKNCLNEDMKAVAYFKPLVKDWFDFNNSEKFLKEIVCISKCVAIGGIKMTKKMSDSLKLKYFKNNITKPFLDLDIQNNFVEKVNSIMKVPVFKHRICAIKFLSNNFECSNKCNEIL